MTNQSIIWQPTDLLAALNQTLEYAYPAVEVEGEVASFKVNQNKYVFFDLKDDQSSLSCFMSLFKLSTKVEDGMKVRVQARLKITNWGKFSLTVDQIQPIGEGNIKKAQQLQLKKLTKEGLFDPSRKQMLPDKIKKIGLISSKQAAGFADFQRILSDRVGGLEVYFKHTQVQGLSAPEQIVAALELLDQKNLDVIALVRGGGSADDLACFDDERVVRAIAAAQTPIITGIGHEIDQTLADLAADVIGATPTHVAQLLSIDQQAIIDDARRTVNAIQQTLLEQISYSIDFTKSQIDNLKQDLVDRLDQRQSQLKIETQLIDSYNPQLILARGYAVVRGSVAVGESIAIETAKQLITAEVKNVRTK